MIPSVLRPTGQVLSKDLWGEELRLSKESASCAFGNLPGRGHQ